MSLSSTFDLMLFARISELKSFSAAAEELGVSRALASKRVSQLEQELNVRLLNRSTRSLQLTEAGETFYRYCTQSNQLTLAVEESLSANNQAIGGSVKIALPNALSRDIICPILPELIAQHPGLQLCFDTNDHFIDPIEGGYDLMLRMGQLPDSNLICKRLSDLRLVTCAAPAYWQQHGTPQQPVELTAHNCLLYSPLKRGQHRWGYFVDGQHQHIAVTGKLEANDDQPLVAAALAGQGVLYAPRFIVHKYLQSERLTEVLTDYEPRNQGIYAVYHEANLLPQKVRVVRDFFAERIQNFCNQIDD